MVKNQPHQTKLAKSKKRHQSVSEKDELYVPTKRQRQRRKKQTQTNKITAWAVPRGRKKLLTDFQTAFDDKIAISPQVKVEENPPAEVFKVPKPVVVKEEEKPHNQLDDKERERKRKEYEKPVTESFFMSNLPKLTKLKKVIIPEMSLLKKYFTPLSTYVVCGLNSIRFERGKIYNLREEPNEKNPLKKVNKCNCESSKCIAKYCPCFSKTLMCSGECGCKGCKNRPKDFFGEENGGQNRKKTERRICKCGKSQCLNNYCECRKNSRSCGPKCGCTGCKNMSDGEYGDDEGSGSEVDLNSVDIDISNSSSV